MQGVGVGGVGVGAGANLNAETDTRDLNTFELAAELDSSGDSKGESQQQNLRTYVRKLALIQSFASSIPPWRRAADSIRLAAEPLPAHRRIWQIPGAMEGPLLTPHRPDARQAKPEEVLVVRGQYWRTHPGNERRRAARPKTEWRSARRSARWRARRRSARWCAGGRRPRRCARRSGWLRSARWCAGGRRRRRVNVGRARARPAW